MSGLGVTGRTNSWEAHECDHQFVDNQSIDIRKSQRLRKESNAWINKVLAMEPALAKMIQKVRISWYFESPKIVYKIAENACGIDFADTGSSKRVHRVSNSQNPCRGTSDYGCEAALELINGVVRVRVQIMGIHARLAPKSTIQWLPATLQNSKWLDDCQIWHWSIGAIPIWDPGDVDEACLHIASPYHRVHWHVWLHEWRYANFG